MINSIIRTLLVIAGITAVSAVMTGRLAYAASPSLAVNRGVIELETGRADDISVRMAGEIASIIDDGATRRVVPVVGKGPLQNLIDLKYLRGIDLAIVQADALDYARQRNFLPGLDLLTYVAKLHNEEFHLLARPDIMAIGDLAGQTVNVDMKDSGTAVTASRLFDLLNIKANLVTDDQRVALENCARAKLRQSPSWQRSRRHYSKSSNRVTVCTCSAFRSPRRLPPLMRRPASPRPTTPTSSRRTVRPTRSQSEAC